jgi:hypothetical protein
VASYHPSITDEQAALIRNAPLFFVATADPNLATGPHGIGPVISPRKVVFRFIYSVPLASHF